MSKAVVIFSGGVDSTAATLWALQQSYDSIELVTFRFGDERRQYGELGAAMNVASELKLRHTVIDHHIPFPAYPLTNQPFCQHTDRKAVPDDDDIAVHGVFPFNVALLVLYGASYAALTGATDVIWGAIKEEAELSSDFTRDYSELLTEVTRRSGSVSKPMNILCPLVDQLKWKVTAEYLDRPGLFEKTWSCKNSGDNMQCGECYGCEGRRMAALMAGLSDRTGYKATEFKHSFKAEEISAFKSGTATPELFQALGVILRGSGKGVRKF